MSNFEKKKKLLEKIHVSLICNILRVFNYICSFLCIIHITMNLRKKIEQYDQPTYTTMFLMYCLKNYCEWFESMGTIILGFGAVVFFIGTFLNRMWQKKWGIHVIVSGALIIVIGVIGNIYISGLGY